MTHTLLWNAYPQFQPRSAFEFLAVVVANKKAPVSPLFRERSLSNVSACRGQRSLARGDGQRAPAADVPLLDRPAGEEGPGDAENAQDDLLEGTKGWWGEEEGEGGRTFR